MKTKVINLLGQPSTGKTTTLADLFSNLKYKEKNVEMVTEWVKKWAYADKPINKYDQLYILGKEVHQQSDLFGKVEYLISDSPVMLTAFYHEMYHNENYLTPIIQHFHEMAEADGVTFYNFFLERHKAYNPNGRYQTADEAARVGHNLKTWLAQNNFDCTYLDCPDNYRVAQILEKIGI